MITPEQALQILDHAAALSHGQRLDHIRIQEATKVLEGFIADFRVKEKFVEPSGTEPRD